MTPKQIFDRAFHLHRQLQRNYRLMSQIEVMPQKDAEDEKRLAELYSESNQIKREFYLLPKPIWRIVDECWKDAPSHYPLHPLKHNSTIGVLKTTFSYLKVRDGETSLWDKNTRLHKRITQRARTWEAVKLYKLTEQNNLR